MKSLLIAHTVPASPFAQFTPSVVGQMSPKESAFLQANKKLLSLLPADHKERIQITLEMAHWEAPRAGGLSHLMGPQPWPLVQTWKINATSCIRLLDPWMISEHFHYLCCDHLEGKWRRSLPGDISQFYVLNIYNVMTINKNFIKLLSIETGVRCCCFFVGFKFM